MLVAECVQMAYIGLGKIVHPGSGKTEVHLDHAEYFIDRLEMLEAKTRGNLSEPEAAQLRRTLTELRLNFVQTRKDEAARKSTPTEPAPSEPTPPAPEEATAPEGPAASKTKADEGDSPRFHKSYGTD